MFSAIAHQIFANDVGSVMHLALTRALREMVVEFLADRINDEPFATLIAMRIDEDFPELKSATVLDPARAFLRLLYVDGTWGSSETLITIATLFNCEIEIFREKGFRTVVTNESVQPTSKIRLVFSGPVNDWNHYESFLVFLENDFSELEMERLRVPPPPSDSWWTRVESTVGTCIALSIKPDGNCLFSATAHQLYGHDINSLARISAASSIRRDVVLYLRSHRFFHRIRSALEERVLSEFPEKPCPCSDDQFDRLLQHLSCEGVWGGTESLIAISEIYKRDIRTIWEHGPTSVISPTSVAINAPLTLVYRKHGDRWIHYDSFLCFEVLTERFPIRSQCFPPTKNKGTGPNASMSDLLGKALASATPSEVGKLNVCSQDLSSHVMGDVASRLTLPSAIADLWPVLKIGSWNVRGVNSVTKRNSVDLYLSLYQFGLVALQETKLTSRTCDTASYKWVLGRTDGRLRNDRRLAFLVHVSWAPYLHKTYDISENVFAMDMHRDGHSAVFINVHMPSDTTTLRGFSDFHHLHNFLHTRKNETTIILGDFNAHLGIHDLTEADKKYVGPSLYHDQCNDNGLELKNVLHMGKYSVKNTWSQSPSLSTT